MHNSRKVKKIISILTELYPDVKPALSFTNQLELLVAVMLSAQTTDNQVNVVTRDLFKKYKKAKDYANADLTQLESEIKSIGFFRNKAKYLIKTGSILCERFSGNVPSTMEDLVSLPGVARKTANIVLSHGFGIVGGIAVDTHVARLSNRLGLSDNKDAARIEKDLLQIFPEKIWGKVNGWLISHGRKVCKARKPLCEKCSLCDYCDYWRKCESKL